MATTIRHNGRTMSVPGGMAIAAIISMGITLLAATVMAAMLNAEKISWQQTGYWIIAVLFLSAYAGSKGAYAAIKRRRLAISLMSGGLYWGLLLCITALFFGGNYDAVPETAAVIVAGSGCAAMVSLPQRQTKPKKKRKV